MPNPTGEPGWPHDAEHAEHLPGPAARISLPGLRWKIWMHEDSQGAAGGSYLFDTEERARAWGDESMPASLGRLPGVSNIQARYSTLTSLERDYTGPLFATEEV